MIAGPNRHLALLLGAGALALSPRVAHAASTASSPAGGGLQAVTASVDTAHARLAYGTCAAAPCATSAGVPVDLGGQPIARGGAQVHDVSVGRGRHALWVHVAAADGEHTWDAVLVGDKASPVRFAGAAGRRAGQSGDMDGEAVEVIAGNGMSFIAKGAVSDDIRLCGQKRTLLRTSVLDAKTMQWHVASIQRVPAAQQAKAKRVVAVARTTPAPRPLAQLLATHAASSSDHGSPGAIADMNPATTWSEGKTSAGRGEFVLFRTPREVPIARLAITVAPPPPAGDAPPSQPTKGGAAPKSFFLVTDDETYAVTMPEDAWQHPGASYDIPLQEPLRASCLALVLDDAYARGNASPVVTVAELSAYSSFDVSGATMETVARTLDGSGGRLADAAEKILDRVGDAAMPAVAAAYAKLDPSGRERAVNVASSASCGPAPTQVFLRALCDADTRVEHKAENALQVCGHRAQIVTAVKAAPDVACPKVFTYLALLGRSGALDVLADRLAKKDKVAARTAFATAARDATPERLTALVADTARAPAVKLEMLRALGPRVAEIAPEALRQLDAMLAGSPTLATRYLALGPLAQLAAAGDAPARDRVARMLASDPDWPVRAHAAEVARRVPSLQAGVVAAAGDPQPRVRMAALDSSAELRSAAVVARAAPLLAHDPWTFVRVSAARALGAGPASPAADGALAAALKGDASPEVRGTAVDALAGHRARAYAGAVRDCLDDEDETIAVREAAARALGAMCAVESVDRLTELAHAAAQPLAADADALVLGLAALEALGQLHPADLASRLAPLRGKNVRDAVRAAAERALVTRGRCH